MDWEISFSKEGALDHEKRDLDERGSLRNESHDSGGK
jgi:hypothetical protein